MSPASPAMKSFKKLCPGRRHKHLMESSGPVD